MTTNKSRAFEEYGLTDDAEHIEAVRTFIAAAVTDGWLIAPTYGSESVERAATLEREGFKMQALMRDDGDKPGYRYQAQIHMWGPDGLSIHPASTYDWPEIQASCRTCNLCGKKDTETFRYSFAGRCCEACVPKARAEYERGNWTA